MEIPAQLDLRGPLVLQVYQVQLVLREIQAYGEVLVPQDFQATRVQLDLMVQPASLEFQEDLDSLVFKVLQARMDLLVKLEVREGQVDKIVFD